MNIVQSSLFSDFWPPVIQELIKFIVRLKADVSVETKFPASNGTDIVPPWKNPVLMSVSVGESLVTQCNR